MNEVQKIIANKELNAAIRLLGRGYIAKKCGFKHENTVSKWYVGGTPKKWCSMLEEETQGKVTKERLRPDLFADCATHLIPQLVGGNQ